MQERQTKQKQVIYDALKFLDHPTATEVYGRVHELYPTVSRATVFRVLNGFSTSGRALELRLAGQETRYDYNVAPHAHARCRSCGRLSDVEAKGIPSEGLQAEACDGFEIEGYMIEFYGTCKECVKNLSDGGKNC
ncbi:MAG: transcriptional repressor [Clostridia bacterium]|nr:transcriptional repressor [Clostridia bacterium]